MRLADQLGRFLHHPAMRADRAGRPANRFEVRPGGFFVVENGVRKVNRHGLISYAIDFRR